MLGDICDVPVVGVECNGSVTQFDINYVGAGQTSGSETYKEVTDAPGYEVMSYRLVPCPTEGNVKFYFPESGSNKWSIAITPYNYYVGIKELLVKGAGSGVNSPNDWISLPRGWTNKFLWRGTEEYPDQEGDIYNGGDSFLVKMISVFDEEIELETAISIPESNPDEERYDMGGQFTIATGLDTSSSSCAWPGPTSYVYWDNVESRKKSDDGLEIESCEIDSEGCRTYFEGFEWNEWWLLHVGDISSYDVEREDDECYSGKCIHIQEAGVGAVFLIGFSSNFDSDIFASISFKAKLLSSASEDEYSSLQITIDGCGETSDAGTVTKDWATFTADISDFDCGEQIKTVKFILSNGNDLLLDEIQLIDR
mmetsp:Transcript_19701/g.16856  ORF Transcript_19701/g.16856 Transcript_19701/m.16856 type:complete len:367 (+) Transcript_19701:413-1513(+)